jgi:hypothetical protein
MKQLTLYLIKNDDSLKCTTSLSKNIIINNYIYNISI